MAATAGRAALESMDKGRTRHLPRQYAQLVADHIGKRGRQQSALATQTQRSRRGLTSRRIPWPKSIGVSAKSPARSDGKPWMMIAGNGLWLRRLRIRFLSIIT